MLPNQPRKMMIFHSSITLSKRRIKISRKYKPKIKKFSKVLTTSSRTLEHQRTSNPSPNKKVPCPQAALKKSSSKVYSIPKD
jgi:hypothetical protein